MDPSPGVDVVVLVCADAEWRALGRQTDAKRMGLSPDGEWFVEQFPRPRGGSSRGIVARTGWGKIAAAAGTQFAIDHWKPRLLLNLGTCGGFEGRIDIGEIVLARRTVVYDIVEQIGDQQLAEEFYATDLDVAWLPDPPPAPVTETTLVSADRDLLAADIPRLNQDHGAVAGDWESGAIAWVAARRNIRCVILRGVTDLVGASGGTAYGDFGASYAANTRLIMSRLWTQLPGWIAGALPPTEGRAP